MTPDGKPSGFRLPEVSPDEALRFAWFLEEVAKALWATQADDMLIRATDHAVEAFPNEPEGLPRCPLPEDDLPF